MRILKSDHVILTAFISCMVFSTPAPAGNAAGKRALLIISPGDFRDEELFETKNVLKKAGIAVTIASRNKGNFKGMLGGKAEATATINEIKVKEFDAIVFIGGSGSSKYINDPKAHEIARQAVKHNKVLAAMVFWILALASVRPLTTTMNCCVKCITSRSWIYQSWQDFLANP